LTEAAERMSSQPIAVQLRFLQTLGEIASDRSSTVVLPIPLDLISPFIDMARSRTAKNNAGD